MAYCVLSGKLLDMVGKPLARATFKFTSSSNSTSIINAVDTVITTDSNGLYYSNLAYGTYTISFRGATDTNYKVIAKNAVIGVLGPITIERLIGHDTEALPSALQDLWTESQANDRGLWTGLGVTRFFEDGFTITNTDQVAANLRTGKLYRWSGAIPPEVLAAWADVEWVRYKLKDGSSNRWHTGLIAQQVIAAFAAHSLDAREYGVVCWEEWEEEAVLAEDGVTVVTPAKTTGAWSVRYDEAYAIESAYQRSK